MTDREQRQPVCPLADQGSGCGRANCPVTRCPRRYALRRRATRAFASRQGRSRWLRRAREWHAPGPGWPGPSLSRQAPRLWPRSQRGSPRLSCSDTGPVIGPPGIWALYLGVITARVLEWLTGVPPQETRFPARDLARATLTTSRANPKSSVHADSLAAWPNVTMTSAGTRTWRQLPTP